MIFFNTIVYVLIAGLCIGVVVSLVFGVLSFIYMIPYALWVGAENTKGRQKDKLQEKYSTKLKHATQLYGAWITRRKPAI